MLVAQVVLCAVLVLCGATLLVVGWRGMRGRLPRNRYLGVRTTAAMRSDAAFELANRAAAPATLASGGVAVLAGASVPALLSGFSLALVSAFGVLGAFVLMNIGGTFGHRAAEALANRAPAEGCGGCAFAGGCAAAALRSGPAQESGTGSASGCAASSHVCG